MKTIDQLKKMDEEQLRQYFNRNARYHQQNPNDSRYSIRLGFRSVFAEDTLELYAKFQKEVKDAQ